MAPPAWQGQGPAGGKGEPGWWAGWLEHGPRGGGREADAKARASRAPEPSESSWGPWNVPPALRMSLAVWGRGY